MVLIRAKLTGGVQATSRPVIISLLMQLVSEGKLLALVESFVAVFIQLFKSGAHVSLTVFFLIALKMSGGVMVM